MALLVEIYSDIICPWCFIGKQRLDKVLASSAGEGVETIWRAYQLRPGLPVEGVDRMRYLTARYGADADPAKVPARIAEEAAAEGLTLNFAAIEKTPNTLLAHRLMHYAGERDRAAQHQLAERLFRDYFCDGRDVGATAVLVDAGTSVGFDRTDLAAYLESDLGLEAVHAELDAAAEHDISGVPSFVLGGRFPLPGAQSADTLTKFIQRAKARFG